LSAAFSSTPAARLGVRRHHGSLCSPRPSTPAVLPDPAAATTALVTVLGRHHVHTHGSGLLANSLASSSLASTPPTCRSLVLPPSPPSCSPLVSPDSLDVALPVGGQLDVGDPVGAVPG
jgi:hypothetical protein